MSARDIHYFDADGQSVLRRRQLERENAILKKKIEILEQLVAVMKRKMERVELSDLQPPTRH